VGTENKTLGMPARNDGLNCVFRRCEWLIPIDVNTDQHAATPATAMMPNFIHMVNLPVANGSRKI